MSDDPLPIKTLISNRCDELGLRPAELVRRCGYKNISKGLRRLESVAQGYFKGNDALIEALSAAIAEREPDSAGTAGDTAGRKTHRLPLSLT